MQCLGAMRVIIRIVTYIRTVEVLIRAVAFRDLMNYPRLVVESPGKFKGAVPGFCPLGRGRRCQPVVARWLDWMFARVVGCALPLERRRRHRPGGQDVEGASRPGSYKVMSARSAHQLTPSSGVDRSR